MKPIPFILLGGLLLLSSAPLSPAQEAGQAQPEVAVEKDLFTLLIGYWIVDFDSAVTKAFIAANTSDADDTPLPEEAEELKTEMAATTFEIKLGAMLAYDDDVNPPIKITIKSQDRAKGMIMADFLSEDDDEPVEMSIVVHGDQCTMSGKNEDGEVLRFGLKRIDTKTFESRVPEELRKKKPDEALDDVNKEPLEYKDGYPVARPVPDKPGFVFSPYNQKIIDVRDIPSDTLVADPHYPSAEKKFFRAP